MLEVVFSDSAKAALMLAKNQSGNQLGGSAADVVCIGFNLDIGKIEGRIDGPCRKDEFIRVFSSVTFTAQEVEWFFRSQREDLKKLRNAAKRKEHIRIWKSMTPFSACGFVYLCHTLQDSRFELSAITLPEYCDVYDSSVQQSADWSGINPEQFIKFLPLERNVTEPEKRHRAKEWKRLVLENAPLRALVNGRLISVPEDFYDHIILSHIPSDEFLMARLIGELLAKHPIGVGDGWYALRIKKLIEQKKLEHVRDIDATHPYGKLLKRGSMW